MSRAHSYSHSRAHSPNFPSFHLRHSSFSSPSVALSTSQLILQPFRCFTYDTAHSPTLLSLLLLHRLFTWRVSHGHSPKGQWLKKWLLLLNTFHPQSFHKHIKNVKLNTGYNRNTILKVPYSIDVIIVMYFSGAFTISRTIFKRKNVSLLCLASRGISTYFLWILYSIVAKTIG